MASFSLRMATDDDAERVALLHADSWRRHYRGAYTDAFLDGDELVAGSNATWSSRLATAVGTATVLAEDESGLAGFVHVVLDDDQQWGSLVDQPARTGQPSPHRDRHKPAERGRLRRPDRAVGPAMYRWVLEQNTPAQAFYRSRGGSRVERAICRPAGIEMNGTPYKLRMSGPDAATLLAGN